MAKIMMGIAPTKASGFNLLLDGYARHCCFFIGVICDVSLQPKRVFGGELFWAFRACRLYYVISGAFLLDIQVVLARVVGVH